MSKAAYPGPWRLLSRRLAPNLIHLDGNGAPPSTFSYLAPVYVVAETRAIGPQSEEWRERHEIGPALYEHDMSTEQAVLFRTAATAVEVLRRVAVARETKKSRRPS